MGLCSAPATGSPATRHPWLVAQMPLCICGCSRWGLGVSPAIIMVRPGLWHLVWELHRCHRWYNMMQHCCLCSVPCVPCALRADHEEHVLSNMAAGERDRLLGLLPMAVTPRGKTRGQ